ncbi:hypothetical protein [Nocardia inohanensis]|uniref:hypothetical protein n=1 Tax=Nocardia inohanensis TaxID=209246 RepID=UPI0008358610|nr:hypothetical protein [Nocardia inohanensis]
MVELGPGTDALRSEIDAFYAGFGYATALRQAFRGAVLLVPINADRQFSVSKFGGVAWICAFTGLEPYARWLSARDELRPGDNHPYQTLSGWRLADYAAGCAEPTGVAVDITGATPMAFPPILNEDQIEELQKQGV